jgi:hypothetical protein
MGRSDRQKMVDFITGRLPDGEGTLVLGAGPGGPVSATVTVLGDDLELAPDCPEWVTVREVYEHLRWAAMPAWEQWAWLGSSGRRAGGEQAQLDRIEAMLATLVRPPGPAAWPAPRGRPGRRAETEEIAEYANELRLQGKTWAKILGECRRRWPDDRRVRGLDQIRATWRRFFRRPRNGSD